MCAANAANAVTTGPRKCTSKGKLLEHRTRKPDTVGTLLGIKFGRANYTGLVYTNAHAQAHGRQEQRCSTTGTKPRLELDILIFYMTFCTVGDGRFIYD